MRVVTLMRTPVPPAAWVLYALGVLALIAVALVLGGGETRPSRWALVAVPVTLLVAASLVVRASRGGPAPAGPPRSDVGYG